MTNYNGEIRLRHWLRPRFVLQIRQNPAPAGFPIPKANIVQPYFIFVLFGCVLLCCLVHNKLID